MKIALIDSDIICYEQGFASQQTIYHCNGRAYETKTDAKKEHGSDAVLIPEVIPMHKRAALKMVRERISGIIEATGASSYECYLTGSDNFREKVATIQKYKGTRHAERPYHYQAIRDYLCDKYGAKIVNGMEADDAVAIRATEEGSDAIICSRDKDLRQVSGYHYSWPVANQPEKPVYWITEEEGLYNLSTQLLTGDVTDNILGCVGIGDKKAESILIASCGDFNTAIKETYEKVYGWMAVDGMVYYQGWDGNRHWKTVDDIIEENYQLLYMKRSWDELS